MKGSGRFYVPRGARGAGSASRVKRQELCAPSPRESDVLLRLAMFRYLSRAQVAETFLTSPEKELQDVSGLYEAALGRPAEPTAQAYWLSQNPAQSLTQVGEAIFSSLSMMRYP